MEFIVLWIPFHLLICHWMQQDMISVPYSFQPGPNQMLTELLLPIALMALGVRDIKECPEGVNEDRISRETFEREA